MTVKEHDLHYYKKVSGSKEQYMCMDPDCTHREFKKFLLHKRARCPICNKDYIMDKESFRRVKLKCQACRTRSNKEIDMIGNLAKKVLIEVPD